MLADIRDSAVLSRSGPAIAVVGIHVLLIYGLVASVGLVEVPKFAEPLQAVFIDAPISEPEPEPIPEVKPDLPEVAPVEQPMPDLQFEEVIVPPAEVATVPSDSAISATEAGAAPQNLKTTSRVEPIYPATSRRMGEEGTVRLRVNVDARGRPADVEVLSSSGFSRLDQAAIDAVKRWKFVAATNGSQPVSAWTQVAITFELKNAG